MTAWRRVERRRLEGVRPDNTALRAVCGGLGGALIEKNTHSVTSIGEEMKRVQTTHPQSNDNDGLMTCRAPHCPPAPTALLSLRVVVWAGPGQLQHIQHFIPRVPSATQVLLTTMAMWGVGGKHGGKALMCEDDVWAMGR